MNLDLDFLDPTSAWAVPENVASTIGSPLYQQSQSPSQLQKQQSLQKNQYQLYQQQQSQQHSQQHNGQLPLQNQQPLMELNYPVLPMDGYEDSFSSTHNNLQLFTEFKKLQDSLTSMPHDYSSVISQYDIDTRSPLTSFPSTGSNSSLELSPDLALTNTNTASADAGNYDYSSWEYLGDAPVVSFPSSEIDINIGHSIMFDDATQNKTITQGHATRSTESYFNAIDNGITGYENVRTINTVELTKPLTKSPILKTQLSSDLFFMNGKSSSATAATTAATDNNTTGFEWDFPINSSDLAGLNGGLNLGKSDELVTDAQSLMSGGIIDSSVSPLSEVESILTGAVENLASSSTTMKDKRNSLSKRRSSVSSITSVGSSAASKSKKVSDSRLSLVQLSFVLKLPNNIKETAKREREVLAILKDDLDFALGEKTWIRDTPSEERVRLIGELYQLVELKHGYGYTKEELSIVVRRASYYLMQGRLRRERRMEKKKGSTDSGSKRKNGKNNSRDSSSNIEEEQEDDDADDIDDYE